MGTVLVLPDLVSPLEEWQQLNVGHRELQIADYRELNGESGDFDQVTAATVHLVRKLPQPVILVGHGFGAFLALNVATTQFGRIDRLMLITPMYQTEKHLVLSSGIHFKSKGSFKATALDKVATGQLVKSTIARDLTNQLMHIQCRTDIFCGEQDRRHKQQAEDLYHRLLEGHLTMIPQMGTKLMTATFDALNEILR
ncbi:alpha/beta fold hydrolase [Lactobacillus sp. 3B(2020)]|uniref:alpha/beta fold hydrolase n=1 Tax=Lactobacillus sp. 3B(2020) TaxID=2695882 RepID=UPI0015DF4DF3|nr:hypothetical protein [Lactobacillus sp. 3B(2020)]QLL69289.1 hypothetical protein GTO83_01290 [Lactobacillus sp. 3B(2020)]